MRFFLCAFALAATILAANGYPTSPSDQDQPRKNPISKPLSNAAEKPRPNIAKPSSSDTQPNSQSPNNFILDVAHSTVMSELPAEGSTPVQISTAEVSAPAQSAVETISHDPILEVGSETHVPESVVQDAIPEIEAAEVLAPAIESQLLSVDSSGASTTSQNMAASASEVMSAAVAEAPEIHSSAQAINADVELLVDNAKMKAPVPNAGKTRRHAGVEVPDALRIGDFEDVESSDTLASEFPTTHEQMEMVQEYSKEEMILMAMEQMHKNRPQVTMNAAARPGPGGRPNLMNSGFKPLHSTSFSDEDDDENDSTVDLRNSGEPATIVQEVIPPPSIPAVKPQFSKETGASGSGSVSTSTHSSHNHTPYGSSKNKPRPYGMDRPSKNRPTLDSGMKDKNEHFGLPHSSSNDYIQKGEMGYGSSHSGSSSGSTNYLGFQIPVIKWASLSDFLPTFWGTQNLKYGKSDRDSEACVDDDDGEINVNEGVRSPVIQGGTFCGSSEVKNNCDSVCKGQGFSSGSCLGPYPTPGCLCRHRSSEDYGLMVRPLQEESLVPEANREQDLQTSVSAPCKKCGCLDSCKKSGSFTGFCADRCYCGVPWSMKKL